MILCIDIGNSDTVLATHNGSEWSAPLRHPTCESTTLATRLTEHFPSTTRVKRAILSSVVPERTTAVIEAVQGWAGVDTLCLGPTLYAYLPLTIANPEEVGTDLVANALAAWAKYQSACAVVDFGTALTLTSVDRNGAIDGVAIAPGLKTAISALARGAAQLPEVPIELPDSVRGKNTAHAIQAGTVWGYVGLVEKLLDRLFIERGGPVPVVATGGLAQVLKPLHRQFDRIDTRHTLEGLRIAAAYFEKAGLL